MVIFMTTINRSARGSAGVLKRKVESDKPESRVTQTYFGPLLPLLPIHIWSSGVLKRRALSDKPESGVSIGTCWHIVPFWELS